MTKSYFVTGTDTEVGKTVASMAIMQAVSKAGYSVVGYKPVAAGSEETEQGPMNSDAIRLRECSTVDVRYQDVNPCLLEAACSPHIAAEIENSSVDFALLSDGLRNIQTKADVTLVEGAGGWRVPVSYDSTLADWVGEEKLPVILVVGIKLGCLNHAYLTAEAIRRDGLEVVGWVANRINPGTEHYSDIVKTLEHHLKVPKLGEIPYMPSIKSRDLSGYIDIAPLGL
ncbi:dethiobiotin synthase [Enterovibrio norvegicus FF-33]|uniref:ATP-dependent dethiobiotin synthetase BioD n=1 Tax=Enterovibrio norvegicus FF-454 TaxID=1185651 RepID=A0A1E5C194_9GAMM|nr:dethiobiotin synthase [Enterovibrio norvegicus]OEE59253.1 dethiobiotin synthase [Enterovibrio norvegicus FF-454]OEE67620.1 dethiobiotin synthase [Enterovibrio norvegicus FF-33]OEE87001.1 dethiobiotin synthase [Enterovibrio norvegicus FF-162]